MSNADHSSAEKKEQLAQALRSGAARVGSINTMRLNAAVHDLFRPEGYRLSDFERTVMQRLLDSLLGDAEDELRTRLLSRSDLPDNPEFKAALGSQRIAIAAPLLQRFSILRDTSLIGVLLHRTDEYRIIKALRQDAITPENGMLDALIEHQDSAIASAAMSVLIAESHRNDRFDEPALSLNDLPEKTLTRLVWSIIAALREYGVQELGANAADLDTVMEGLGREFLLQSDKTQSLPHAAIMLAVKLNDAGLLGDGVLVEALGSTRLFLYVAMVAERAGMPFNTAWELVTNAESAPHILLLRVAGIERRAAAHLAAMMTRATGGDDAIMADWLDIYEDIELPLAQSLLKPWRFDENYGAALADISLAASGTRL